MWKNPTEMSTTVSSAILWSTNYRPLRVINYALMRPSGAVQVKLSRHDETDPSGSKPVLQWE